ncbi:ATP-binding cassette, subfamily B [Gracilibacillus ureilyticus]|uniref:ATP-binding cassette, subfamily B n=1 Tax=Gracilibacillus ureilyticus TaxID=531814 RepID=A0A1H9UHK3_9BACI|nr:ABC transporter ATP-binding protein [Gracilibacillus ureilyticus]SES08721.1 ATP-binding cassette, subfamily B [Gracilibacillus ureilyticus]
MTNKNRRKKNSIPPLKTYWWIISYLRPYRWQVFLFIVCSLIAVGVEMSIPKGVQYLIDHIIPNEQTSQLVNILAIFSIFLVIMFLAMMLRNSLQRIIQEKAAQDLQTSLFTHLRKLGFAYYERKPIGKTLSLFSSEVIAVQQIYSRYFPAIIINSIVLIITAAFMISINWKLCLLIIPFFLSYYLIGPYFEKKAAVYAKETQQSRNQLNKKIYDSVSGLLELKANNRENWDLALTEEKLSLFHKDFMKQLVMNYARGLVRRVTIYFGAVAIFAYSAVLIQNNQLTIGEFVALTFYYFLVIRYMTVIVTNISEQTILMNQAEQLFTFVHEKPEIEESKSPVILEKVCGNMEFRDIHFGYPSMPNILKGFNLTIHAGEKIAIVGKSGNGKSTLLKLIGRFYDPQQGTVFLEGVPLSKLSLSQIRDSIGFVFQDTYLFNKSIKENVKFGNPDATDEEIVEACKQANAHKFISELQDGYETVVGNRGIRLSGGQKQRMAIARMILKDPKIIVLDEATSSLDNLSEKEVKSAFDTLLEGKTIIAVAHRLSTIENYDRIIMMEDGKNVEIESYQELMKHSSPFAQKAGVLIE